MAELRRQHLKDLLFVVPRILFLVCSPFLMQMYTCFCKGGPPVHPFVLYLLLYTIVHFVLIRRDVVSTPEETRPYL